MLIVVFSDGVKKNLATSKCSKVDLETEEVKWLTMIAQDRGGNRSKRRRFESASVPTLS